ncbi:MAG: LysR family transcriptional regulator [Rhodospirillales bacterium]
MDWDKLRVFHAVAEAGSFTHAGDVLNLSQSSVSRQISALERSLNTALFHRHARGLKLTEQGELLYRTAREVFAKLAMVETLVAESRDRPKGPLRITTTVAFGSIWLTERIREFIEAYPEISVTLIVTDEELDLSMGQADVGIRMTPPRQADLVQRHLITMHHRAYASPAYLKRYGTPKALEDLDAHRLIAYDETFHPPFTNINWLIEAGSRSGGGRQPVLRVNNIYAMFRAAAGGLGIAPLPDYMAKLALDLEPVLPSLEGPTFDVYFVYPEELRHSKRIAVFRDFLLAKIDEDRRAEGA